MLMRIILVKLKLYVTEMPKHKNFTISFPGETLLELKKKNAPQK